MSFGWGAGDIVKAIELAILIRSRFVNAPAQFKAIFAGFGPSIPHSPMHDSRVQSLTRLLEQVRDALPRNLNAGQRRLLESILENVGQNLSELDEILDKYQELGPIDPTKSTLYNFKVKVVRGWKRVKWEPTDITELRDRFVSNLTMLNAFYGQLTNQQVSELKNGVERASRRQAGKDITEELKSMLEWLCPVDYISQQNDAISRRQGKSGQWLLDSTEFLTWLNQKQRALFCYGMPGAGKTMLSSILIEYLQDNFWQEDDFGIAYIYINYQQQQQQQPLDLLSCILKQLIQKRGSIPPSLKQECHDHLARGSRPSLQRISEELHSLIKSFPRTFIVIDALDECRTSDGSGNAFLTALLQLQSAAGANILVTSRDIPEYRARFDSMKTTCTSMEVRAAEDDIRSYIRGHMFQISPSVLSQDGGLQGEIEDHITKAIDGMFLLARLHMDSLVGVESPKAIRKILENLPSGSDAYDDSYATAMQRIDNQPKNSRSLALRVLSWVTCAKRPLKTLELQHALAVEEQAGELDETNIAPIEALISACAGLVTVDEARNVIRLVHYTTQEYLRRNLEKWVPTAKQDIAATCVAYLSMDHFFEGGCKSYTEYYKRIQAYPFLIYAADNWGYHVSEAPDLQREKVFTLLKSGGAVSSCIQAIRLDSIPEPYRHKRLTPPQATGLHLVAHFGINISPMELLPPGDSKADFVNSKDWLGRTPLVWAAREGNEASAKSLLADGAIVDAWDECGRAPLMYAALKGHTKMVELLLDHGARIDGRGPNPYRKLMHSYLPFLDDDFFFVPFIDDDKPKRPTQAECGHLLSDVASIGNVDVMALLLDRLALGSSLSFKKAPFSSAVSMGMRAATRILGAQEAGINLQDDDGLSPLSHAAAAGHDTMVKLLLARGAEVDPENKYGWTPLAHAASHGYSTVVQILIDAGANINLKDEFNKSPLLLAARASHYGLVEILLGQGAEPQCVVSLYEFIALSLRVSKAKVVETLLDQGAEVDSRDAAGRTALSHAAEGNFLDSIGLLLGQGSRPETKENAGHCPLSYAGATAFYDAMKLMLDEGVDLNVDRAGRRVSLLRIIMSYDKEKILKAMFDYGKKLDLKNDSRPPRMLCDNEGAFNYGLSVVKRLIDRGANVNSKDNDGRTPLS
ncbi:uncharacterized protein GIQ15_04044 [Arthroderma uncinatum]|uniref:uncharacterized protein n=1 Tax=Arthroderma uncinatum TaxID=74035 RepID=UPI00144A74E9|nr:uncharacterized protein GIQ15_04044 [Arthroderma uncinatum]KAF3481285.1 hypothetical protein GIQ15_04044 [Arthroderma uncinatum]